MGVDGIAAIGAIGAIGILQRRSPDTVRGRVVAALGTEINLGLACVLRGFYPAATCGLRHGPGSSDALAVLALAPTPAQSRSLPAPRIAAALHACGSQA
jgi:hypothetical protein